MSLQPGALPHETVVSPRIVLGYDDVLSDDGTRLRAWTNDPHGAIDGPTVLLCNGLGTNQWAWPALLDPALRGAGRVVEPPGHLGLGPSRGPGPGRHRGVRRGRAVGDGPLRPRAGRGDGLVDRRQHRLRARRAAPRAGGRPVRGRRRPRRHLPDHARPVAPPARGGPAADGRDRPGAAGHRPGADPGRLPAAGGAARGRRCSATAASCSRSRTSSSPCAPSTSSSRPRWSGTSTSRCGPRSTPASPCRRSGCRR